MTVCGPSPSLGSGGRCPTLFPIGCIDWEKATAAHNSAAHTIIRRRMGCFMPRQGGKGQGEYPAGPPRHLKPAPATNYPSAMQEGDYLPLIELALREDLGALGDVTSEATVADGESSATLWSKDEGILTGETVFRAVFHAVDPGVTVTFSAHDGASLSTERARGKGAGEDALPSFGRADGSQLHLLSPRHCVGDAKARGPGPGLGPRNHP